MRKRPDQKTLEENFINNAQAYKDDSATNEKPKPTKTTDKDTALKQMDWPLLGEVNISYEEGSSLRKPISLPLKEFEWNTLEKHTKLLGVNKSEWIRHAIFSLMEKEKSIMTDG